MTTIHIQIADTNVSRLLAYLNKDKHIKAIEINNTRVTNRRKKKLPFDSLVQESLAKLWENEAENVWDDVL